MSAAQSFGVEFLPDTNRLEPVLELYRKNTKTLGFLPVGAFQQHAANHQLLVATHDDCSCMGYLLFRIARGRAAVVHLCVPSEHRGRGIGYALINRLKLETRHLLGIGLYCRRDYEATIKWPRYGFVAKYTKHGRGVDHAELTFWWFDHNHPDLFSLAQSTIEDERLCVVIDANVFFDLFDRTTPESEDSQALLAVWLEEIIELCLTNEIHNDINRSQSESKRQRSLANTTKYRVLGTSGTTVQSLINKLRSIIPATACLRDESDVRHLAHAIAAGAEFFVTRDVSLIERAEPLYERYGLWVLHPATLINELDSLQREKEYRPARLEGTPHRDGLLKASELPGVLDAFRLQDERQSDLEKTLKHVLAKPAEFECRVAATNDGKPLVLSVVALGMRQHLEVVMLRVSRATLAPTVVRHIMRSLIGIAVKESAIDLTISDGRVQPLVVAALQELGFGRADRNWTKILSKGILPVGDLRAYAGGPLSLPPGSELMRTAVAALDDYDAHSDSARAAKLEHLFWPAKVKGAPLSTYVLPIQPRWAQHFFDTELGSQMLFGLRSDLHLGIEGVYYRSARGPRISAPGRIFWYVSQGENNEGAMAIKACSRLEEVVIGTAKDVYRRFRRLGIFQRKDVIMAAGGTPDGMAMALRFTMTERFEIPVTLEWLNSHGIAGNFMGPRELAVQEFEEVYRKGFNLV